MVKFVLGLHKLKNFGVCTERKEEDECKGMEECVTFMY